MRYLACSILFTACAAPDPATPDAPTTECAAPVGTFHGMTLAKGDGVEDRYYWLHIPATYDCAAPSPTPLLVDFHGTSSQEPLPEESYQTDALIAFSDANGVIVARPRSRAATFDGGSIYQWDANVGDIPRNIVFADNLVAAIATSYAVDPTRVYASGFSSGSNMVAQFLGDAHSPFHGIAPIAGGDWSGLLHMPSLASGGPRVYMSTGYRDYLWPYASRQIAAMTAAGLPAAQLDIRHTGGGHDLYPWHFDELWQFLDGGTPQGGGTLAAAWTTTTLPSPADVNAFADDGGTLVAAGARGRTWRLGAGGWTSDLDRGDSDYTALCFGANGSAFVGGGQHAAAATSGAWSTSKTLPDYGGQIGYGWVNAATCRDDGSLIVVGYWSAETSSDGGATWSQFSSPSAYPGVEAMMAGVATSSSGATVAAGYYDYIGRAAPGSLGSAPIAPPVLAEWWNGVTAIDHQFWAVGDGGSILTSLDDGKTWTAQTSGTTENLYAVHFADANNGAAVGRRGTVVVTTDGGLHWTPRAFGLDIYLGAVFVDATTVRVAGEGGLVATSAR